MVTRYRKKNAFCKQLSKQMDTWLYHHRKDVELLTFVCSSSHHEQQQQQEFFGLLWTVDGSWSARETSCTSTETKTVATIDTTSDRVCGSTITAAAATTRQQRRCYRYDGPGSAAYSYRRDCK